VLYTAAEMRERSSSGGKASRLAVYSWILYDFSNTIFSITILSFYFPL
jgi:UMF1 family MFS transporter